MHPCQKICLGDGELGLLAASLAVKCLVVGVQNNDSAWAIENYEDTHQERR